MERQKQLFLKPDTAVVDQGKALQKDLLKAQHRALLPIHNGKLAGFFVRIQKDAVLLSSRQGRQDGAGEKGMVQVINKAVFLRLGFGKKLWIAEGFRLRRQDGLHVHQNGINALGHQFFRMEVACAKHLEQGAQSAQVPEVPPRLRLGGSRGGRDVLAKGIALPQNAVRNAGDVGKPPVHDLPEQHIRPAVSRLIVKAPFFRIHPDGGSSVKMLICHLGAPAGDASEILPGKKGGADLPPVCCDPLHQLQKGGAETVCAAVEPSGKQRGGRKQ